LPAVGDWVAAIPRPGEAAGIVHAVLPRRSRFSRKVAGGITDEQVLAANMDTVFLVCGLDGDFNLRRIERYLAPAYDSGASPVILLNKADLCQDLAARLAEVEAIAAGAPVHAISAADNQNIDAVCQYLATGRTAAFLGSSGVGKSTVINRLIGQDRQRTGEVRTHDSHGRHTTTHRELILLDGGGMVIDTPGMRELQLWSDDSAAVDEAFEDVERLARACRFRDCRHEAEPGCAIRVAIEDGTLDPGRYDNYLKLQRELRFLERRRNQRFAQQEKDRWKHIHQLQKQLKKNHHKFR
jgi:ribosome biogenesis GTPase